MQTGPTNTYTKTLILVSISLISLALLIVQVDALSASPRFGIRAGDYVSNQHVLNAWRESGKLPSLTNIGENPTMQYNYATMLAQQGEEVGFPDAVDPWKQAIGIYESIDAQEVKDFAQYNKTILQQLIDESVFADPENSTEQQQGQENSQQQEPQAEERGDAGNEESQSGEEGEGDQENDGQPGSQGEPSDQPQESGLTQEQLQQLQDYQQQLQQQQFQNQKYFGKQQQDQPQSVFEQFFGQPQFQQNANSTEKDR